MKNVKSCLNVLLLIAFLILADQLIKLNLPVSYNSVIIPRIYKNNIYAKYRWSL